MSMTREQLRRGFMFTDIDEFMSWKDSYHESESFAFASGAKRITCDQCSKPIEAGDLYSIGGRQVYPDAPIYGDWVDKVHLACVGWWTEAEAFKRNPPSELPGWAEVPEERKRKYLEAAGLEATPERLKCKPSVFHGMTCIIAGEFSLPKETIAAEIEANGGKVIDAIAKSTVVTHVVLGSDGKTKYGQPTGRRSKKYRDAMKKKPKPTVVDYEWVQNAVKKGDPVIAVEEEEEEKEEEEEADEGKGKESGTKRKRKTPAKSSAASSKKKTRKAKDEDDDEEEEEGEEGEKEAVEYVEADLEKMARSELQKLSKKHGLKANGTTKSMIAALAALGKK